MGKLFRNKFFVALLMILSIGSAVNANAQKSKFPSMKQLAASATQHIKTGHMINRAPKAKAPDANAEVLYDEDFSAFTEGSDEQLGENVTAGYNSGDPYINPKYVHGQSGWWGVGVYSAGGMVALAYPNYGGVINTPMREMYGRLHVSFRVKVRDGNPATWRAPVIVNCCKGNINGPSAVNNIPTIEATNVSKNSYTANWEESPKALRYDVNNYKATEIKESTADYPVLVDNFTNAKTDGGKVVVSDETSFDAYTDNKGWTATSDGLLYDKAIGICSLGTLYSPEMTLNNNNGKFKVHLKLKGYNGAKLAVQSVSTYGVVKLKTTGSENFTAQADTTLTFEDGKAAERLMFYACGTSLQGVVIESIEVTQDVEPGNHVYQLEGRNILDAGNTSCDFGNLTSDNYAYTVTAKGNYYGENYSSVPSAYQAVSLNTTAISGMPTANGSALRIAGINGNMITVSTDGSKKIMVYDISGNLCQAVNATAGETSLSVGGTGVYVVTDGTDAYKVTVK